MIIIIMLPKNIKKVKQLNGIFIDAVYQLLDDTLPQDLFFVVSVSCMDNSTAAILTSDTGCQRNHGWSSENIELLKKKMSSLSYDRAGRYFLNEGNYTDSEIMLWTIAGSPYKKYLHLVEYGTHDEQKLMKFKQILDNPDSTKSDIVSQFDEMYTKQLEEYQSFLKLC